MIGDLIALDRKLVGVDLETTGTDTSLARIVQIGLIVVQPGGEVSKRWSTLIDPREPIPAGATATHHITDEMVAGKPTFASIAKNIAAGLADADVFGYRVTYDLAVLAAEFARAGIAFDRGRIRILDGHRLWQLLEPRTLEDAVRYWLKREHRGAHDAVDDIEESAEVIHAQLTAAGGKLGTSVQAVHDLSFPRDPDAIDDDGKIKWANGEAVVAFGKKWKGVPLRRVDRSYLEWMASADFSPSTKAIVREALQGRYPKR